jgi:hypothetical protein
VAERLKIVSVESGAAFANGNDVINFDSEHHIPIALALSAQRLTR